MADSEEVELVSEDEIGEPRKRQESFSTRVTRHYKRLSLILRICMFLLTGAAVLLVIAVQTISILFGSPLATDNTFPARVGLYGISVCQVIIGIVVIFLELDISCVRTFFRFASFYIGKSMLQILLGLLCFSQAVSFEQSEQPSIRNYMPLVKEIAGYIMFGVGALHFFMGLLCLDIILIRTRSWY